MKNRRITGKLLTTITALSLATLSLATEAAQAAAQTAPELVLTCTKSYPDASTGKVDCTNSTDRTIEFRAVASCPGEVGIGYWVTVRPGERGSSSAECLVVEDVYWEER
ncbi:hypothetical protein ACIOGX_12120 [Streptomyces sp. NPDC088147]|uniref:hypothetical protein n=1 Tax=Streptomyces sp. NPDC088147 TaxID=3365830 RepID=UPI00382525F0